MTVEETYSSSFIRRYLRRSIVHGVVEYPPEGREGLPVQVFLDSPTDLAKAYDAIASGAPVIVDEAGTLSIIHAPVAYIYVPPTGAGEEEK